MSTDRKKLRLDLNELRVQEFATAENGAAKRGTVHGNSDIPTQCNNDMSCPCTREELSCSGDHPCLCTGGFCI